MEFNNFSSKTPRLCVCVVEHPNTMDLAPTFVMETFFTASDKEAIKMMQKLLIPLIEAGYQIVPNTSIQTLLVPENIARDWIENYNESILCAVAVLAIRKANFGNQDKAAILVNFSISENREKAEQVFNDHINNSSDTIHITGSECHDLQFEGIHKWISELPQLNDDIQTNALMTAYLIDEVFRLGVNEATLKQAERNLWTMQVDDVGSHTKLGVVIQEEDLDFHAIRGPLITEVNNLIFTHGPNYQIAKRPEKIPLAFR